jgi:glycine/D-amino acid oxidase-like deaminating enzyme
MTKKRPHSYDVAVIGAGITGACVAYGLQRLGCKTAMLDTSPGQIGVEKASRGNMGLIWCQSKFAHFPMYAKWGFTASDLYAGFIENLEELTGMDVRYRPTGGLIPCLGEDEYTARSNYLDELRKSLGTDYPAQMLSLRELREKLPRVSFGTEVCGAVWCDKDGFIDSLQLLYAVRKAFTQLGGDFHPEAPVFDILPESDGYKVKTPNRTFLAKRLVLAAGLSNKKLCRSLGCCVPIFADRGQVMLTERIEDVLPIPMLGITRTPGGTLMIGFMHERAGLDTLVDPGSVIKEGRWALRVWPALENLRIIRSWGCLRVMPEDGQPIYDTIPDHPGIFLLNAHSGITLAPAHAEILAPWIAGRSTLPEDATSFSLSRFSAREYICQ